jgi:NAD(P)-dependent dehydrogenase (short-subunit alcohol dehydrogenase family)
VAPVTGAGSGMGRVLRRHTGDARRQVVVADVNLDAAERVAKEIGRSGRVAAMHADVADPASVEAKGRFAVDTFGGLDVAVNNAGIGGVRAPTGEYSIEGWLRVIDVNLNSVFCCMRREIPAMLARGGGVARARHPRVG